MQKPLPRQTPRALNPPADVLEPYTFFEAAREHPLEPLDTSLNLRNAWWLCDAALLAYSAEAAVNGCVRESRYPRRRRALSRHAQHAGLRHVDAGRDRAGISRDTGGRLLVIGARFHRRRAVPADPRFARRPRSRGISWRTRGGVATDSRTPQGRTGEKAKATVDHRPQPGRGACGDSGEPLL